MREAEQGEQGDLTVVDVLSQYGIERLSLEILDSYVEFLGDHTAPLSIREAMRLPANELVQTPLRIIEQREKLLTENKGPRGRSSRVIREIRSQAISRKGRLLNEGPGEILASIVANSGRKAKWNASGLVGIGTEWQEPERSEVEWWKWFYGQFHSPQVELPSLQGINILHAAFVVRSKQKSSGNEPLEFIQKMEPFLDPELEIFLAKITKYFSQTLKRR